MRFLTAATHKRMAWKNGGGETIEIAVQPPGAGLAAFDWRLSTAIVRADGPFSLFPGVDRTLALLTGEGMELAVEGRGPHRLTTESEPFAFPADAPTVARLPGGPITDFNAMTRRGAFAHRMKRLGGESFEAKARWTVLFAGEGASIGLDGRALRLDPLDALLLEERAVIEYRETAAATVFVVEIDAVP